MKHELRCSEIKVSSDISLYHTGPSLEEGPLPSLFYFALSGPDSLCLDPFNQPVQFLQGRKIRVFSMTLPGHENGLPATRAISLWAEEINRGVNCLGSFLDQVQAAIDFAIQEGLADPAKIGAAGLSRGGLLAFHTAAREERIRFVVGFAPVTRLGFAKEFSAMQDHPIVASLNAENLVDSLYDRSICLYIGNNDTRVGTRSCFDFAMALAEKAAENKIRSPQIEMEIRPSIGLMGHGTPPEVFRRGAEWIASCLKVE